MKLLSFIIACLLSFSNLALAVNEYPNNTNTELSSYQNEGAVVESAYVYKHLYGQEVLVTLWVPDTSVDKEIWVFQPEKTPMTTRAFWTQELWKFYSGGLNAMWLESKNGFARILVKVPTLGLISWDGNGVNHQVLDIYIKMANQQVAAKNIQVKVK